MSISFTGTYDQSFEVLASSGTNNVWSNDGTLLGWFLFRKPSANPLAITSTSTECGIVSHATQILQLLQYSSPSRFWTAEDILREPILQSRLGPGKRLISLAGDTISAGNRDVITGGSGNDADDDIVIGTIGNRALGGDGNDSFTINEGAGTNYLNGGAGSDQFWLISAPGDKPASKQFVMDFTAGEDKVGLQGVSFSALSFTQEGGDTLLKVNGTDMGHFANVSSSILHNQTNFLLA